MDIKTYIAQADSIVSDHFRNYIKIGQNVGVLLSGGIDSSLISSYVFSFFPQAHIFSMGTDLTKDRPFVEIMSKHLGRPYEWIFLSEQQIKEVQSEVGALLEQVGVERSSMQMALATGYFLIFKRASELGTKTIVTGQGPDILFAGYHMYKKLDGSLLNAQIKKDLVLLETDKKRDGAMASHFGIQLLNPYLETDFVDFSLTVPVEYKINNGIEKVFMR